MSIAAQEMNELHSHAGGTTRLLKAMANEHRLLVLCALAGGEMSVGQINYVVPLSQSSLSQHLGILRESGLVTTRRDAQAIFYRLKGDEAIRVIELLQSAKGLDVVEDAPASVPEKWVS